MTETADFPILELRHVESEGPGAYDAYLNAAATVHTVRLWKEPLPSHVDLSAIIVMGGPMGVNDGRRVEWINEEIAYIARAVEAGVPVWGVCLGAQLLAAALGARVYTGDVPEVGVLDVQMTPAAKSDPVWSGLPRSFPALQWHGDSFDLPDGAVRLAGSRVYTNQLFRYGNSYGVQFHLEADRALAGQWLEIDEYVTSLEQSQGAGAAERLLLDIEESEQATVAHAGSVMRRWLATVSRSRKSQV